MNGKARLAWNVRRLRISRELTQESLAIDANVAIPYVSRIENGSANPSIEVIDRIADALHVEVDELLRAYDRRTTRPKTLKAGRKPANVGRR